jgi:hypothetical protein
LPLLVRLFVHRSIVPGVVKAIHRPLRLGRQVDPSLMTERDPYEVRFFVSDYCNNGRSEAACTSWVVG